MKGKIINNVDKLIDCGISTISAKKIAGKVINVKKNGKNDGVQYYEIDEPNIICWQLNDKNIIFSWKERYKNDR